MKNIMSQQIMMPASKLPIPTTTGTHTGMEEEHFGDIVALRVVVVLGVGLEVVTGGTAGLLPLVKIKGESCRER